MISKYKILEYHYKNTDESSLGCDANQWHKRCWRCGYVRALEKCHIIPKALKGNNKDPSNYVLLCNMCHQEAPNVRDPNEIFVWIRETCISSYDCFWNYRQIIQNIMMDASTHFGHGNKFNLSTRNWIFKEITKQITDYSLIPNIEKILKSINMGIYWDKYVSKEEIINFQNQQIKIKQLINK
tara:strand:+ start:230 stop:778 length:549 start_codon:yes stop_codon:yes gene_type:complete